MSALRPTLWYGSTNKPCMTNGTAYLMILSAVQRQHGLLHGRLEHQHEFCAIGSYFDINSSTALPCALIDEVAAVNDSVPQMTKVQRKKYVTRWLRWKLTRLGMTLTGRKSLQP